MRKDSLEDGNDDKDDSVVVLDTPPRAIRVSQGGISIILAVRSLEAPQRPIPAPLFRLFPEEPSGPPVLIAPPKASYRGRTG